MHRPKKLRISALKINIRRQTFDSRLNQYIVSHKKNHLRDRGAKIGKGTKQHPGKLEKRGEGGEKSLKKVLTKGGGFGIIAKLS